MTKGASIYCNPVALFFNFRDVVLGILSLLLIYNQVVNYFLKLILLLTQSSVAQTYVLD